jgi:two-component system response regulator RegA
MNDLAAGVGPAERQLLGHVQEPRGRLLLVDEERSSRARLQRSLTLYGFAVTGVGSVCDALETAAKTKFAYAVVEMRLPDGNGLMLLKRLLQVRPELRLVIHTDFDSFASVVLALRHGAVDYLVKPAEIVELVDALHGSVLSADIVPDTPLGVDRLCWEHIHRIYEQCERNVSRTAQMLGMHRRTLQRMFAKRAPRPRAVEPCGGG